MEQGIDLHGASAIIEKDLSSGLLAQELNADTLLILTSVEKVSLNLGQDNEEYLNTISVDDAKKYMADNQFVPTAPCFLNSKPESLLSKREITEERSSQILRMQRMDISKKPELSLNDSIAILVNNTFKRIAIFYLTIQKDIYQSNTYHLAGICLLIIIL